MKLENQVCSLDLAKRLKELGVKQESEFHWYTKLLKRTESNEESIMLWGRTEISDYSTGREEEIASVFTCR
jgi:hypothetical protein